jgi:pilus assembly protein CpaF
MNSELCRDDLVAHLRCDLEDLLRRLPGEIQLDLANAANRVQVRDKVHDLLQGHVQRERILQELFGCGPLTALLQDPTITEILVNGPDSIWLERDGIFQSHSDRFLSAFTLSQFVQLVCLESRLRLDLNQPFADGMWRGLRVHLAQQPLVNFSHTICLRRHPQASWTLAQLAQADFVTNRDLELLRDLLKKRENLLIVGPTGAGKTSLLSALLTELPDTERVVVIEDTSEIHSPNSLATKLLTRFDQQGVLRNFELADLVRQSLRMRPSRLALGEVRGGEAKDLLLALSTGHSGSMGSLHANSARQAILRLEMLVQMGAPDWGLDTVRKLIHLSLNALVVVKMENGKRSLEGIHKICSLENCGFLLEKMK